MKTCVHCGARVELIRYALGEQWMHVAANASFPTTQKGTAWKFCKLSVATPKEES